jgi:NADPH-dependent curcumin reductase CurA
MPELPQGGLLLRVLYLSLDPYMRGGSLISL